MPAKSPVPAILLALAMMLGLLGAVSTTTPAVAATTYKISYNANGGTGAPAAQTAKPKVGLNLSTKVPKRATYTFKGWATKASAKNPQYKPGEAFFASKSITLYAVWHLNYVALGDSYSSGEGAVPDKDETQFLKDPGFGDTRACHRSALAYSGVIDREPTLELRARRACSGATSANVVSTAQSASGAPITSRQIDYVNDGTALITITIGGNDPQVGFSDIIKKCLSVADGCYPALPEVQAAMKKLSSPTIKKNLTSTYATILKKAPKAKVLVLGYPDMTPGKKADGTYKPMCGSLARGDLDGPNSDISKALSTLTAKLNSSVSGAVKEAAKSYSGRIYFLSTTSAGAPFKGHDLCSSTPYINDFVLPPREMYSFHPNYLGQQAYAKIVSTFIKDKGWAK